MMTIRFLQIAIGTLFINIGLWFLPGWYMKDRYLWGLKQAQDLMEKEFAYEKREGEV